MEQQQQTRDIRLDLSEFSDDALRHALAFLLGGVSQCKKNEADPQSAETGKVLLGLAMTLQYHLPPPEPKPEPIPGLSMN